VGIVKSLADGLATLHMQDYVHCRLRPSTVWHTFLPPASRGLGDASSITRFGDIPSITPQGETAPHQANIRYASPEVPPPPLPWVKKQRTILPISSKSRNKGSILEQSSHYGAHTIPPSLLSATLTHCPRQNVPRSVYSRLALGQDTAESPYIEHE